MKRKRNGNQERKARAEVDKKPASHRLTLDLVFNRHSTEVPTFPFLAFLVPGCNRQAQDIFSKLNPYCLSLHFMSFTFLLALEFLSFHFLSATSFAYKLLFFYLEMCLKNKK